MEMKDSEIVKSYKAARYKKQQINILAELNAVTPEEIKAILKANNVDLRGGNYRTKPTEEKPKETPEIEAADPEPGELGYKEPEPKPKSVSPQIPATIMEAAAFGIELLNRDIESLEKEFEDIARRIKDLKNKKAEITEAILAFEGEPWKDN